MSGHFFWRSAVVILPWLLVMLPSSAMAAPVTVSNLNDSGPGSLRQALEQARASAGADTIAFEPGLTGTLTLTSGPLTVSSDVVLQGPGANALAISGGGSQRLFTITAGTFQLSGLTLREGRATVGAGMLVEPGSAAQVSDCAFTGNAATNGAGIFAADSQLTVSGCTFTNNTAVHGGGIHTTRVPLTLTNSTFAGNQVYYGGAGVFVFGAPAIVDRCIFLGNQSADAALTLTHTPGGRSLVTNCLFAGNFTPGTGAILLFSNAHASIVNCTVAGNTGGIATGTGISVLGGISGPSSAVVANSIVWGNSSFAGSVPQIVAIGGSTGEIKYSSVQGDIGPEFTTDHLVTADPLFVRPPNLTATPPDPGDLHLQSGSPAINAGSNALLPASITLDLDGQPRIGAGAIDLGAYEAGATEMGASGAGPRALARLLAEARAVQAGRVHGGGAMILDGGLRLGSLSSRSFARPVQAVLTTLSSGVSLASITGAAPVMVSNLNDSGPGSLRQALEQARASAGADTIAFEPGLTGTLTLTSGPLTVSSDVAVQGPGADVLAISGGGVQRLFTVTAGTFQLSGLTLREGRALLGGAMLLEPGSAAQVFNCTFTGNTAVDGGGIYAASSQLTVTGCTFTNNTANDGAGIYPDTSTLTLTNSTFAGNQAYYGGAGVFVFGTPATVDRCVFLGNQSADAALAFTHTPAGRSLVTNSLFVGNVSPGAGSILAASRADAAIINCTVAGNIGGAISGAGITALAGISGPSSVTVANSIVRGNGSFAPPPFVATQIVSFTTPAEVTYSNVELGTLQVNEGLTIFPGTGNVNADPLFVRPPNLTATPPDPGDLRLQSGSPSINTGSNALLPAGVALDLDGMPRISAGTIDMGAYEAPGPSAAEADASGFAPASFRTEKMSTALAPPLTPRGRRART